MCLAGLCEASSKQSAEQDLLPARAQMLRLHITDPPTCCAIFCCFAIIRVVFLGRSDILKNVTIISRSATEERHTPGSSVGSAVAGKLSSMAGAGGEEVMWAELCATGE